MGVKKEIGKKIMNLRIARGYTQDKLSEMVNISQRALSSIELGINFVTADTLDKLLVALDTTLEELCATNSTKEPEELLKMINLNLSQIGNTPDKLEIIYNLTRSLNRN